MYKLTVHEIEIHTSIQIDELNMTDKKIDKHEIKIENFRDTVSIILRIYMKRSSKKSMIIMKPTIEDMQKVIKSKLNQIPNHFIENL